MRVTLRFVSSFALLIGFASRAQGQTFPTDAGSPNVPVAPKGDSSAFAPGPPPYAPLPEPPSSTVGINLASDATVIWAGKHNDALDEWERRAIGSLIQKLSSSKAGDRFEAIMSLKKPGPDAKAAIPALTELSAKDPEADIRDLAKKCLTIYLIRKLYSSEQGERFEAIVALKKLGADAKDAIPALTELSTKDPEAEIRELAKKCLTSIQAPADPKPPAQLDFARLLRPVQPDFARPPREPVIHLPSVDASQVQNQPFRYAIVTLTNKTQQTVIYRYHWGEGNVWHRIELQPGKEHWHSWDYPAPNVKQSPHFHIRFDSFLGAATSEKEYNLDKNAARSKDSDLGRHHDFKASADGHSIDLFKRASTSINN